MIVKLLEYSNLTGRWVGGELLTRLAVLILWTLSVVSLVFADEKASLPAVDRVVKIHFRGEDDIFEQCIESGLTVKYRYSFRLCKSRVGWFHTCLDTRRQIHHMETDPIRNAYRITVDRHGDDDEPVSTFVKSKKQAYQKLSSIESFPLDFIGADDLEYARSQRSYLDVRVESHCQGRYNKTLARISYFLTLGLVDIIGFDSGWQEFPLSEIKNHSIVELR